MGNPCSGIKFKFDFGDEVWFEKIFELGI